MTDTNSIGLHEGSASQLAEKLNHLLANYQIFYMNVRGYHWNVRGNDFSSCTPSLKSSIPTC
ncbi:hypothetical protein HORIV_56410 [Vreelandella olivaria]|uniref:DNA starvation/stationary phase protection protein n=1 Tax=Vreelandella olivaria TaxID=390919 RepID=A0ABN5X3I7_9GAMM|nr:hypothetical protein HORIV_56410 [Halomonas olivaria]